MRLLFATVTLAAAVAANAQYQVVIAGATFGNNTAPYNNGVLRYKIGAGGVATAATGIGASQVVDPAGLALSSSGELFVGNRNGNSNNPGGGSVSRFLYDASTDAYVANGSFATATTGIHGVAITSAGKLYAAGVSGPTAIFDITAGGATANGSLGTASARDVLISPDGLYAYVTTGVNGNLQKWSVASNSLLNTFSVPGASGLHFGAWRGSDLYIGDYSSNQVFDLAFDASGDIAASTVAASASTAIGVGFSPDATEMFVTGHTSGLVSRYLRTGNTWTPDGTINTGVNMGDIQIVANPVPEPASFAALGLGVVAFAKRRRR